MSIFTSFIKRDVLSQKQAQLKKNVNKSIDSLNELESIVQDLSDTNILIGNQAQEIVEIKAQFDIIQGELTDRKTANQKIIDKFRS